jgi:hypothetical protein
VAFAGTKLKVKLMARARNIKPSFFQNELLAELEPLERLAFIGMWTIADFKGCIEFRPKRLKVQLLPYDNCDFEAIAINLEKSGFISTYSVQGQRYLKIINFEKHQNPHKNEREAGSDIPDILDGCESVIKNSDLRNIENNPDKNGTARADSPNPLTDSLLLNPDNTHTVENTPSPEPTQIGRVCVAIKNEYLMQEKSLIDLSQSNPTFIELIKAGATVEEFVDAARISAGSGNGFKYLVGIVKRQREQALNLKIHKGAMPVSNNREAGRHVAAKSIFKPANTQHLMGTKEKEVSDATAITN